jgi:hypothetical protein
LASGAVKELSWAGSGIATEPSGRGINSARKGWLTKENILNTRPLGEVRKLLKR